MSAFPNREDLTDEQAKTLEKAAYLIINARIEAASALTQAGIGPMPNSGWWGNPCGTLLPPPPQNQRCGCRNYEGDGGPCLTRYRDFTGPDLGTGAPLRNCGHRPSEHLET